MYEAHRLIRGRDRNTSFLDTECPNRGHKKGNKGNEGNRDKNPRTRDKNKMMRGEGEATREEK